MDLKYPSPDRLARIARWMASPDAMEHFADFFGPAVVLVPAPGHAPLKQHRVSPSSELATALVREGLGRQRTWLQRDQKVLKSAWAGRGSRPTEHDHYRTISAHRPPSLALGAALSITVVDDVINTGATLHACVRRLATAYPLAEILAFAMVRARSDLDQVESVTDPVSHGTITLEPGGQTRRSP